MTKLLIAKNLESAIGTAEIDFKWERIGKFEFKNNNGDKVRIIRGERDLAGLSSVTLYIGFGFFDRNDYQRILDIVRSRRKFEIIDFKKG